MPRLSYQQFLERYDLDIAKEFEVDGRTAAWATVTGPRQWGQEDAVIEFPHGQKTKRRHVGISAAVSGDEQFIVVSVNSIITVFSIEAKEARTTLFGHTGRVKEVFFLPANAEKRAPGLESATYVLIAQSEHEYEQDGSLILWPLDADGRATDNAMSPALDIQALTESAVAAISPSLQDHYHFSTDAVNSLKADFTKSLQEADTRNRARHVLHSKCHFPSFGTNPISHDGCRVLYIICGESTQSGMRPADELPQIGIMDLKTGQEVARLKGHTDAIMKVEWSSDDKTIASACWDGTFKLWDATTGECKHTFGPTGVQNWACAFSPDGSKVLFSAAGGVDDGHVNIYRTTDFEKVKTLTAPDGVKLDSWIRYLDWHPENRGIALVNKKGLLLWDAEAEEGHDVQEIFRLAKLEDSLMNGMASVSTVKWADDGHKMLLKTNDQSLFVWDKERHVKWRFERPKGSSSDISGWDEFFYLKSQDTLVSVDDDYKIRFWKL